MQRIWSSGSAVWPPLIWPITSVSASSTTSLSIRPEPGIEGPPVWMVLWMPYLRAQPTILRAVGPSLTPPRPERALRKDRHRLEANDVAGPAGHVHFAGRDHGGDAAMQIAVDPAALILPRRPVAGDGVDMAVDQAGRDRGAGGIDGRGGVLGVDVLGAADG